MSPAGLKHFISESSDPAHTFSVSFSNAVLLQNAKAETFRRQYLTQPPLTAIKFSQGVHTREVQMNVSDATGLTFGHLIDVAEEQRGGLCRGHCTAPDPFCMQRWSIEAACPIAAAEEHDDHSCKLEESLMTDG